jgi:hypothetical protein
MQHEFRKYGAVEGIQSDNSRQWSSPAALGIGIVSLPVFFFLDNLAEFSVVHGRRGWLVIET